MHHITISNIVPSSKRSSMFCPLNCHVFYITSHVFWLQYHFCQWNSNSWWCQTTIFDGSSPLISPISQSCRSKSKFFPVNIPFFSQWFGRNPWWKPHHSATQWLYFSCISAIFSLCSPSRCRSWKAIRESSSSTSADPPRKNRSLNVTVPAKMRDSANSWVDITPPGDEQGLDRSCHF